MRRRGLFRGKRRLSPETGAAVEKIRIFFENSFIL